MKKPVVHITDHALVRYLERVLLVDVERLRRRIGRKIDALLIEELPDPSGVTVNGVTYKLRGKAVTTCVPVKKRTRRGQRRRK
ncbi:hypothetical protein GTA62_12975 [Roseobacter sp. HKCCD9010]|uniref:hypothetical protein n=1 Tax=unclassified Roseobacter TaxID=196798 RepID=UPI0014911B3C|nr:MULTISPECIES: hypothetical protein [unclassified Roseobacter]MBF9049903.1 hypothetical protein [Rhodobacterales bacterium HKCCD4356]NNV13558.1 hypothetical protein [Roseobacter sp. HKCCD7357]NNV16392.1 hypothetical protein [Roseobacter sp. HKCCD8768]NNV25851.1 hypothetical protein [Roseobacter sp. HKCCD8192]NNV30109.1 hypothetical protein [Roseobacter sp. HKCCD9061]